MKLIITGITGRMGAEVAKAVLADKTLEIAGLPARNIELHGHDVGSLIGLPEQSVAIQPQSGIDFSQADAIIDFTLPQALSHWVKIAVENQLPLVTGTTGLDEALQSQVVDAARHIPIVQSYNMSLGVNLLAALVEQAAKALDDSFDIEISETHHRHKKDAPSGTALLLGEAAALGREVSLKDKQVMDRDGTRQTGDIGFSVIRGGGVIGDHTVALMGENEQIEISHRAHNRSIYAHGALKAAKWIKNKPPGLYSMRDVLGV